MFVVDPKLRKIIDDARSEGVLAFAKVRDKNFCENLYYRKDGVDMSVLKNIKTSNIPEDVFNQAIQESKNGR